MDDKSPKLKSNNGSVELVEGEFVGRKKEPEPETVSELDSLIDFYKRADPPKVEKSISGRVQDCLYSYVSKAKNYLTDENYRTCMGAVVVSGLVINTVIQVGYFISELVK